MNKQRKGEFANIHMKRITILHCLIGLWLLQNRLDLYHYGLTLLNQKLVHINHRRIRLKGGIDSFETSLGMVRENLTAMSIYQQE